MGLPKRILIVDDDEKILSILKDLVRSFGHVPEVAKDGFEALGKVKLDIDLVLLDAVMPGMDGYEVARRIREDPDDNGIPILMITGLESDDYRIRADEVGVNDFISKPFENVELKLRVSSLLKMKEYRDEVKRHRAELEETVRKRTATLRKTIDALIEAQRENHKAQLETIHRLAVVAEFKDKDTAMHINRVKYYCEAIAKGLNLSPGEVELLLHASPMHDVGKIGIPENILLKPAKLDPEEWTLMKRHTILGGRILNHSAPKLLRAAEIIALSHHERWDGSGYPQGLAEEEIPVWGRICAVADVFDALTSRRPYKDPFRNEAAFEMMREGKEMQFDPEILEVFFTKTDEILEIQKCMATPEEGS